MVSLAERIEQIQKERQKEKKRSAFRDAQRIATFLKERYRPKKIVLFGSLVRNSDFDVASDIDIAVEGLRENYLRAYAECMEKTKFELDIRDDEMPKEWKKRILKEGVLLYER